MKLYNSFTQSKEPFQPLRDKEVTMYVCGITPYDTTHLGHAFTYTAFDILVRYLTHLKYKVNYTQNVTDIDDDILKKAKEVNKDWKDLGQFWTDLFVKDNKILNNTPPTHYVKATDTIPTMREIIEKLASEGFAYEAGGNIYFRNKKYPEYGKLSGYTQLEMTQLSRQRGANPDDPNKEDPLDFILWQKSLPDEPSWDSPKIGEKVLPQGRPGWHIECSAMIYKYLYKNIDIHGGGIDLIYPHHESERAQSEAFTGTKPFVKYWMHTGPVRYEGEKMSKSLGNLVMVSELLKTYSADAIRCMLLTHHYRATWEYHESELKKAQFLMDQSTKVIKEEPTKQGIEPIEIFKAFADALEDDLDTPKALTIFFNLMDEQAKDPSYKRQDSLYHMADLLGFYL